MLLWLLYPVFGSIAGVIAGLLGVGVGIVVVPILFFLFTSQGAPPEHIMQMALGTSLGSIMFTSVSSFRAHHQRGAVHWDIVRRITPGILVGTFGGTWVAALLSTNFLKGFFALFLYYVSAQMLLNFKPKPTRQLPGRRGMFGVGGVIGVVSSLVGIGGGTLSVPFMSWCNIPVHHAIGTSAAIGFPIAVAGTLGYIVNGLRVAGLPELNLGYLNIPALFGIALFSMLTAPLGARLAHRLPVVALKRFFAVFLILTATRMVWGLLG
ncbi:MAG: sulfite exporter TauE/SafE family protein [Desulfobacteraceae bacterium]|nr:MAG: sulfite exporter TauE/SafE family protein [Desulfobacteraceae bacterium]